jgi:hypothetical protein
MPTTFIQQLYGAWRVLGYDASPRPDGSGITFGCPKCQSLTSRLEFTDRMALCPSCAWGAEGEPWEIALAAKGVAKVATTDDDAKLLELLKAAAFNAGNPPLQPVPIYCLAGYTVATPENIMVIQAKMKAGKSAAVGAMIAAPMNAGGDCLWFTSQNEDGKAVVHFDTEQSSYDHHQLILRALRRAGRSSAPPWLLSYHLKGKSIETMRGMVTTALQAAQAQCAGIHAVLIDGIADLCADVNDSAESNEVVAWLEEMAMTYKTLVVVVLHENHGSDSGKTRGHLGSQLARKAETNLRLEKNGDGVTLMYADTSRSVHISKKNALGFAWNDDLKTHERVETTGASMAFLKKQREYFLLAQKCAELTGGGEMTYTALRSAVMQDRNCKESWAEKLIGTMVKFGALKKENDGYQVPQPSTLE